MAVDTGILLRRAFESTGSRLSGVHGEPSSPPQLSPWAIFLIVLTSITFYVLIAGVYYSYFGVVGVLTIIESPQTNAYVSVDSRPSSDKEEAKEEAGEPEISQPLLEAEAVLVKDTVITSSIHRTILHLRSKYGYFSRFRGFSLFLCFTIIHTSFTQALYSLSFMKNVGGILAGVILADILLARLEMAWIHIVISKPTGERWWKRVLPLSKSVKIVPAVALYTLTKSFASLISLFLAEKSGAFDVFMQPGSKPTPNDIMGAFKVGMGLVALNIVFFVLFRIPSIAVFVRVAASMLPAEAETVVPFDRSFGGRVTPAALGGKGKIDIVGAWTSFDRSGRIRLFKLVVKVVTILVFLYTSFILAIVGETYMGGGREILNSMGKALWDRSN